MGELEDKISAVLGDPEQLGRLTKMAQNLMGGTDGVGDRLKELFGGSSSPTKDEDEREMLAGMTRVMQGLSHKNEHTALLEAMKPYLTEKRRNKMDKAMKLAKMARVAELAFGKGEDFGL